MQSNNTFGFVDGAYLRELASFAGRPLLNPYQVIGVVLQHASHTQYHAHLPAMVNLSRVVYYDALPSEESTDSNKLREYWDAIELLTDTHLGFGWVRGKKGNKPPQQKAVDTLIAVDMLVGAFTGLFSVAVLIAGDADFVPVIHEVKRCGVTTIVAATNKSVSRELKRAADRFCMIDEKLPEIYHPLKVDGKVWETKD